MQGACNISILKRDYGNQRAALSRTVEILFSRLILILGISFLRFAIFTMNKAVVAILVIALVAGLFVGNGDALLRAGRDRIGKLQQAMEERREAAAAKRETPLCWPVAGEDSENHSRGFIEHHSSISDVTIETETIGNINGE